MLIPLGTDAPIYHYPIVTIGIIVVNVLACVGTIAGSPEAVLPWCLEHGAGLHPVQWITSNFLHDGFGHLLGNMLFLWVFGLIVEGKLGWWRFLLLYLGIGALQCAIEQLIFLDAEPGHSLGASAVVYGLMAVALVWAPVNEIEVLWVYSMWFGMVRSTTTELSVRTIAGFYLVVDFVLAGVQGFQVSTQLLHLQGAVLGFAVGVVLLKLDWVDCENWDLFSVVSGKAERSARRHSDRPAVDLGTAPSAIEDTAPIERLPTVPAPEAALAEIRQHLSQGRAGAALQVYTQATHFRGRWDLPAAELRQLIDLLAEDRQWADAVQFLEEFIRRFPDEATPARLKLAKIVLRELQRPRYALRLIENLPDTSLTPRLAATRDAIVREAQALIDTGILEIEI